MVIRALKALIFLFIIQIITVEAEDLMLVELLILILGAGLISELVPKNRLPVLWSLFSAAAVSYFVYRLSLLGNAPDLYLNCPWLKIPNLAVNLEIVVNAGNIYLVFALSILALLVLLQNTFGAENAKIP